MSGWAALLLLALAVALAGGLWTVVAIMMKEISNRSSGIMHDGVESLL